MPAGYTVLDGATLTALPQSLSGPLFLQRWNRARCPVGHGMVDPLGQAPTGYTGSLLDRFVVGQEVD